MQSLPILRASVRRAILGLVFSLLAAGFATLSPLYASAAEIVHVVAKGQTLGRIAKRYHTTAATLREVNDIRPGQRIHPGLVLVIPEKGREKEAAKRAASLRNGDVDDRAKSGGKRGSTASRDKDDVRATRSGDVAHAYARKPKRPGLVHLVRGNEHADVQVLTRHGRLVPSSLATFGRVLRFFPTNGKTAIDPRLVTLVGLVSDRFGGRQLNIVSGFRPYTPTQYTPHSNHNVGRAMDFNVEGVPNTVLRDFCRTFRNAGVGYYPNSSFVHLDARTGKVTWVDYSHAGEAPRYDSPGGSADADEAARDVKSDPIEPSSGSEDTHPGAGQDADLQNGNAHDADIDKGAAGKAGTARPTPPAASSSTPDAPPPTR